MNDLSHSGMAQLIEQLIIRRQHLDEVIDWLKNLKIKSSIPGLDAEAIAMAVDGQTLHLWKKAPQPMAAADQNLVGRCSRIKTIAGIALRMADRSENVTLLGETGVGKGFLAAFIHNQGRRRDQPFIRVPGLALGDEQEISRHIDQAGRGTLYINNLEDLDDRAQISLWEQLVCPEATGSCRVISSSQVDLDQLVTQGVFNPLLKEYLSQCSIPLPPLRERLADLSDLVTGFLPELCRKNNKQLKVMSPEFLSALEFYDWPGNIRELINTLEHAINVAGDKPTLFSKDLPSKIRIETSQKAAQAKRGL